MKYLVSEIEGGQLDAAVAKADGMKFVLVRTMMDVPGLSKCVLFHGLTDFAPSSDLSHGGPIIERESIDVHKVNDSHFGARLWIRVDDDTITNCDSSGPTMLIAAMRAFVVAKLDDEVDL